MIFLTILPVSVRPNFVKFSTVTFWYYIENFFRAETSKEAVKSIYIYISNIKPYDTILDSFNTIIIFPCILYLYLGLYRVVVPIPR